jgi:hypothetical protein
MGELETFKDLIPELTEHYRDVASPVKWFIYQNSSISIAIAHSTVFWPEFIEWNQGVFMRSSFSEESAQQWLNDLNSIISVERLMNHIHITSLFAPYQGDPSEPQIVYLGRTLREIWKTKLSRDFPTKRFIVSFNEDLPSSCGSDEEYDLYDYQVTFVRSHLSPPLLG